MHSTEKMCNTTLDDKDASQHVMSILVTALCNQPEAFASYLGDDQSCYLFLVVSVRAVQAPSFESLDVQVLVSVCKYIKTTRSQSSIKVVHQVKGYISVTKYTHMGDLSLTEKNLVFRLELWN